MWIAKHFKKTILYQTYLQLLIDYARLVFIFWKLFAFVGIDIDIKI